MVQSDVTVDKGYCLTNLHSIPGTHGKVEGELTPERGPLTSPCEVGHVSSISNNAMNTFY